MSTPLIDLSDIRKTYRTGGGVEVEVLRGVSLSIHPGEFVAIIGQSGSGKTTLMNILGCLDRPSSGTYRFNGRDAASLDRDALAELRREAFGFVFQHYHLIAGATAQENVEVPAVYAGLRPEERRARSSQLLARLGLGERMHHRPNQMSGGQQQRVSIARALMNGGAVILADEPTGALDSKSGAEVMALLKDLAAQGHTIILITHDRNIANAAERVIEMRDGSVVSDSGVRPARNATLPLIATDDGASLWSDAGEALKAAIRALAVNPFRTALTLLGIIIGVASVVALLAIGEGAKREVMARVGALGDNLVYIIAGNGDNRMPAMPLTEADTIALEELPNMESAMPYLDMGVTVRYGNRDHRAEAMGTSTALPVTHKWRVEKGSFFTKNDQIAGAAIAVLGHNVAAKLFPDGENPLGRYVLIQDIPFLVTGVMAKKGDLTGRQDTDNWVFMPLSTCIQRLVGKPDLPLIVGSVYDTSRIAATQQAIRELLISRHRQEDFVIRDMTQRIQTTTQTQNTMTLLLGCTAAISLLVGGIGVMNIMLMSVAERTREIGIRMATGARTRDIQRQFLTEAALVSGIGGVAGVMLGVLAGVVVALAAMPVIFSVTAMAGAFACAVITGLVFGFMPARRAARLEPVSALASE